jgi:hypothetical protein
MSRLHNGTEIQWIDLYSHPYFQGRVFRFYGTSSNGCAEFSQKKLPKFGSVIVGPGNNAQVRLQGRARPITLRAKTVLADTGRHINGSKVQSVLLMPSP